MPGAAGTWRDLTDNVNQLAANLTTQVRAIAEVATAVTKGDLTRSITVEAQGEVAALKDNINEMIRNLRDTTQKNTEQDWLKTNLAKFTRMLQGQRDLLDGGPADPVRADAAGRRAARRLLHHGRPPSDEPIAEAARQLRLPASASTSPTASALGEGLVGQCALEKERILLTDVPDDYIQISSGLGEAPPRNIIVLPVLFEGEVKAVIELASFHRFSDIHLTFLDQLTESIGIVLNTIAANMRTEELLKQSQSLTEELQTSRRSSPRPTAAGAAGRSLQASEELLKQQQDELQQTNEELEEKAELLAEQNAEVERKNREVEQARAGAGGEGRAARADLEVQVRVPRQHVARAAHAAQQPADPVADCSSENPDGNLTDQAGRVRQDDPLLRATTCSTLINDILDLSKIESGTMAIDVSAVPFADARATTSSAPSGRSRTTRASSFDVELGPDLPPAIHTDSKRLQQVLKNLLSNAFKFTEQGRRDAARQRRPSRAGARSTTS